MPKQSRKKPAQKARLDATYARLVKFPQARGRTVEKVELSLDSDFHCISIRFKDNTDLTVVIDTTLTFPQSIPSGRLETRRSSSGGQRFAATTAEQWLKTN